MYQRFDLVVVVRSDAVLVELPSMLRLIESLGERLAMALAEATTDDRECALLTLSDALDELRGDWRALLNVNAALGSVARPVVR